jgi:exonuclease SbcC
MLIRRISLRNIRSYNSDRTIELEVPEGTVLIEGDVGAGKSTILYAVEFALFGLGEMKMRGEYLLSEGREEGHAELVFEVDGSEYTVHRGLRRRKSSVVQAECYMTSAGAKTDLSPGELKERVISLLGFNEPQHPNAESMVYRFAVFTPQEQMKEILLRDAEDRLQVVRRILGMQSYQTAAENSELVEKRLKTDAYGLEKASEDLEDKERTMQSSAKRITELDSQIPLLKREEVQTASDLEKMDSEWKALSDDRARLAALVNTIPDLQEELRRAERIAREEAVGVLRKERRLRDDYLSFIQAFDAKEPPSKTGDSKQLLDMIAEKQSLLDQKHKSATILEENSARATELMAKGVCPLCGQSIPSDFSSKADHLEEESAALNLEISGLERELSQINSREREMESYERDAIEYTRIKKEASRLEEDLTEARSRMDEARTKAELVTKRLAEAAKDQEGLKQVSDKINRTESLRAAALKRKEDAAGSLTQAVTRREEETKKLEELVREIEKKRKERQESKKLTDYQHWLSTFFRPTLAMIEKQTLAQADARFNYHFQRFFSALVEDPDLNVRVKEDFSPVFERQGFEQDFEALSGGERTSVALAYRFALNAIASEDTSGQGELVILDEPTDGFSKEQIYKMRDLLLELHSKQVLVVSHEKELESMSDVVFHVKKVDGTSVLSKS